jgi:hypothetical protein
VCCFGVVGGGLLVVVCVFWLSALCYGCAKSPCFRLLFAKGQLKPFLTISPHFCGTQSKPKTTAFQKITSYLSFTLHSKG